MRMHHLPCRRVRALLPLKLFSQSSVFLQCMRAIQETKEKKEGGSVPPFDSNVYYFAPVIAPYSKNSVSQVLRQKHIFRKTWRA